MASGKETTCFWRVVFVTRFLPPQRALLPQSWRWGDVGHVVFVLLWSWWAFRGPQLLQTLESVGIAVGGCVLFHSVVLHCDSVVVRGFPFGFTAAPQIFGVDFLFFFAISSKKAQKEHFGSDTFWGLVVFGCSTQCRPYFCSVLRVRNSIRFGSSGFSVFFGGHRPCFLTGVKNLILGGGEKECGKGNERLVVKNHDDGRELWHFHFSVQTHLKEIASGIRKSNKNSVDAHNM